MPGLFEQDDPFAKDVDEEVAPEPELLVHILEAVIDKADRGPERLSFRQFGEQPVLGLRPELGNVGQILVVDNDQQIEVRIVASDRILDPVAPGIASEQDDLQKLAVAKARLGAMRNRRRESIADNLDDARQLPLLGVRKMADIGPHGSHS